MLEGIDVSSHQGSINWRKVAEAVSFAFIKVTEGKTFVDPSAIPGRMKAMREEFNRYQIGYYHFARPDNNRAKDEAEHFVKQVKKIGGDLDRNGVLDYEVAHPGNDDEAWIRAFTSRYKELTGSRCIIYGGHILREELSRVHAKRGTGGNELGNPALRSHEPLELKEEDWGIMGRVAQSADDDFGCPLWLAAYVWNPNPYVPMPWRGPDDHRMKLWQYTENGMCQGVSGHVDRNKFYGDVEDLRNFMVD